MLKASELEKIEDVIDELKKIQNVNMTNTSQNCDVHKLFDEISKLVKSKSMCE